MREPVYLRIVIPTYNRADMLMALLLKIKATVSESNLIEVVVVDDGSGGDDKSKLHQFSKKEDFVRFIFFETNKGGCFARNAGAFLEERRVEWVWFFDDDDEVSTAVITEVLSRLHSVRDMDLVFLSARYHKKNSVVELVPNGSGLFSVFSRVGHQVNTSCVIFRYDLLIKINGWDSDLIAGQDTDIFLRAAELSDASVFGNLFVDVNDHEGDRITRNPSKQILGKIQFLKKNYRRLHPMRSLRYLATIVTLYPYVRNILRRYQ